jgi:hypothetical protein
VKRRNLLLAAAGLALATGFAAPALAVDTSTTVTVTGAAGLSINVPRTAFSVSAAAGDNSASWNPTIVINIPTGTTGGIYTGTVTHSVF